MKDAAILQQLRAAIWRSLAYALVHLIVRGASPRAARAARARLESVEITDTMICHIADVEAAELLAMLIKRRDQN